MQHLLFPDEEISTLPTFLSIWEERIDEVIRKARYKYDWGYDMVEPEQAQKGTSWNQLQDYEEQFCVSPRIAAHYFTENRVLWRLADPTQPEDPNPTFITQEFTSLSELAEHLVTKGLMEEEVLFPNRILNRIPLETNGRTAQANGQAHHLTGRADIANGTTDNHAPQEPQANLRDPPEQIITPQPASAQHDDQPPPPPRTTAGVPPRSGIYPLDLLLRLRQTYRAKSAEDSKSFQIALDLIRNCPGQNVEKSAHYTSFRRFDLDCPTASLKAVYFPRLQWSIEIQAKTGTQIPLPSQLAQTAELETLLTHWRTFKNHLPLYQGLTSPSEHPGPKGFILINENLELKPPPPLLTVESASGLNQLIDRGSPEQKRLIQACLHQSRQTYDDIQIGPNRQRSPQQHELEDQKLAAYSYALTLDIDPNPEKERQLPPLRAQEAITLLSIRAPELIAPASPAQQILYHRITAALRRESLNDQQRKAIADYFPTGCQNLEFINYAVKTQGILPADPKATHNLITFACENADSRLLSNLFQLTDQAGVKIKLNCGDTDKFTRWILSKAYPDKERASRCLKHLPLAPATRLLLNSQLRKPGWQNKAAPSINI